jgi:hypothetical protein
MSAADPGDHAFRIFYKTGEDLRQMWVSAKADAPQRGNPLTAHGNAMGTWVPQNNAP